MWNPRKKEQTHPLFHLIHLEAEGWVGGGASRGRPPREGSQGCVTIPPTVEDLGVDDDDNKLFRDPLEEEEDEI